MGSHAFKTEPEHCALYRAFLGDDLPPLHGAADRWNMPTARHRMAIPKNARFEGVGHNILTYHAGGAAVRRTDGFTSAVARKGSMALQPVGTSVTLSSEGIVDYAHFYFNQSLMCEVADEAAHPVNAEPEAFFALFDDPLAGDLAAYLARSNDRHEPATAIEMDTRAYLIALGTLRVARRRSALVDLCDDHDVRADMKRVLRQIEDRLNEPLRLSDLAEIVRMSPFHFARVFKQQIGEPPAQYLQRRRTERAIELLRESRLPLSEIAFRTGFSSQSHMNRRVKTITGLTPKQIRMGE